MKDAEVKEKLEQMSALSGGMVFAKEEAWEKLQARLDVPAKKAIIPWYRLAIAAAAVLLLSIGIYMYLQPATTPVTNTIVKVAPKEEIPPTPATTVAVQEPTPPTTTAPETIRISLPKPKATTTPTYAIEEKKRDCIVPLEYPEKPVIPLAQSPAKKMRIVHINDIGKTEETPAEAITYNGPSLDISKMKVVSIYDVQQEQQLQRQAEEIMAIARLNRPHNLFFGTNALTRRGNSNASFASNLFSIQLNRKN